MHCWAFKTRYACIQINKRHFLLNKRSKYNYTIRILNKENKAEVVKLIKDYAAPGFKAIYGNETDSLEDYVNFFALRAELCLNQRYSFGAFETSSDRLVSFMLNTIAEKWLDPPIEEYEKYGMKFNDSLVTRIRMSTELEKGIFKKLGTDKIFFEIFGCTHPKFRETDLIKKMIGKSRELAVQSGYKYAVGKVTQTRLSKHVRIAATFVNRINVAEYADPISGLKCFKNIAKSHSVMALYYTDIQESLEFYKINVSK